MTTEEDFLRKRRLAALIGARANGVPNAVITAQQDDNDLPRAEVSVEALTTDEDAHPSPIKDEGAWEKEIPLSSAKTDAVFAAAQVLSVRVDKEIAAGVPKGERSWNVKNLAILLKRADILAGTPLDDYESEDEVPSSERVQAATQASLPRAESLARRPISKALIGGIATVVFAGSIAFFVLRSSEEPMPAAPSHAVEPAPSLPPAPSPPEPVVLEVPAALPVVIEPDLVEPPALLELVKEEQRPPEVAPVATAPVSNPRSKPPATASPRPAFKPAPKPIEKQEAWQEKAIDDIAEFERQLGG